VERIVSTSYNLNMADPLWRDLAASSVRRQTKRLAEELDGLRAAEDVECVHRARVATRRLRAALRMFRDCFPRKKIQRWRKIIRRTTDRLGAARDCDVQIEWLCGVLASLDADRKDCLPGIARILVSLERNREAMQRKVVRAVDRLESSGVLRAMRRAAARCAGNDDSVTERPHAPKSLRRARRRILRRLKKLLRHQRCLSDPEDRRGHHVLRIAAKRLRYTLEIARPVFPGRLDEALASVKRVQSLLGEIHDCDVWDERLDALAAKRRRRIVACFGHAGRFARDGAGIAYLRADRRRRRGEVFRELVEFWDALGRAGAWETLADAVQ